MSGLESKRINSIEVTRYGLSSVFANNHMVCYNYLFFRHVCQEHLKRLAVGYLNHIFSRSKSFLPEGVASAKACRLDNKET